MGAEPGPVASQDWFLDNLKQVLKTVPKEKVICSLGSYGYDWTTTLPPELPTGKKPARTQKSQSGKGSVDDTSLHPAGVAGGGGFGIADRP